ncbi:MAG: hypothetical protein R2806_23645 [Saprospiraceae bacterium]
MKGQGQEPYQEWSFRGMGCGVWGIQPIAGSRNRSVQRTVRKGIFTPDGSAHSGKWRGFWGNVLFSIFQQDVTGYHSFTR